jgi:hypothetical protein
MTKALDVVFKAMILQQTFIWQAPLLSAEVATLQRFEYVVADSLLVWLEYNVDPQPYLCSPLWINGRNLDHLQRTQATRISIEQLARSLTKSISHSRVDQCVERPLLIISGRVPWPWARNHVHDWL